MKKFIKKPIVIGVIIIVLIVGGFVVFKGDDAPIYDTIVVAPVDLVQEVDVTGTIKPVDEVELSFRNSDRVSAVSVDVGDKVRQGDVLVRLDNTELLADLANAEAALAGEKAKLKQLEAAYSAEEAELAELKIGTRPEEILIQEAKVADAQVTVAEAKKSLVDTLQDAYTKSDDAIRNKVDQFFTNPRTASPNLNFVADIQKESDIESGRIAVENMLVSWKKKLEVLSVTSDLHAFSIAARANLNSLQLFLDDVAFALNDASRPEEVTQTTFDGWKSGVASARTNINTAITNLSASEEALNGAETNLVVVENELALKKAGNTKEQILAKEAVVEKAKADIVSGSAKIRQAEANIQTVRAKLARYVLTSPIDGIVTKQETEVGEIVTANTPVVSVISGSAFQIDADVPEADIAKISVGNKARVTLDAYGEDVMFNAHIVSIDPAETIIEGVATYKTTLLFDNEDKRIRPGMTANIDVLTASKEHIIAIPRRAVISKNGKKFVRILDRENIIEREIVTGLTGNGGVIEITSGLNEGERVITVLRESGK